MHTASDPKESTYSGGPLIDGRVGQGISIWWLRIFPGEVVEDLPVVLWKRFAMANEESLNLLSPPNRQMLERGPKGIGCVAGGAMCLEQPGPFGLPRGRVRRGDIGPCREPREQHCRCQEQAAQKGGDTSDNDVSHRSDHLEALGLDRPGGNAKRHECALEMVHHRRGTAHEELVPEVLTREALRQQFAGDEASRAVPLC